MDKSTPNTGVLEHVNLTVANAASTAEMLCRIFAWEIRWQGSSRDGGTSIHVGTDDQYLVAYSPPDQLAPRQGSETRYLHAGGLNHVGMVVEDLDATEARVRAEGYVPYGHESYEPGRRFYFLDLDGIEFEVVSYRQ